MSTEVVLVRQIGVRSVRVERTISIEVPVGLREQARIQSLIKRGVLFYGPFPFEPVEGSEHVEPGEICALGTADGPAEIPLRAEFGI
jgi:hypothetical protein